MIHKEGFTTLVVGLVASILVMGAAKMWMPVILIPLGILLAALYIFLISFFRNPKRKIPKHDDRLVYAPCDGKVVVIEKTVDVGYLKQEAIQVSIFMSPLNVHVNRHPIDAEVIHSQHHIGKFLPAWDPKSSIENERTTIVYKTKHGLIVMRQIAGALAKRIINYTKVGDKAVQGDDMGFIKFGSRVDLFLPLGTDIIVKINDTVKGNETIIAKF